MLELTVGQSTDLYIINKESQQVVLFKDVKLTMQDVWQAVQQCDGCSLDDPEDNYRILQTVLDIINQKKDS